MRTRIILGVTLLLCGCLYVANDDASSPLLEHLARHSEIVFVGTVSQIAAPNPVVTGVREYAIVSVDRSVKGTARDEEIWFVTEGFSAELDQHCCEIGAQYLFFGRIGYGVFELSATGEASVVRRGIDRFVSASDSRRRVFRIADERVCGWGGHLATICQYEIDEVLAAINHELARNRNQ